MLYCLFINAIQVTGWKDCHSNAGLPTLLIFVEASQI